MENKQKTYKHPDRQNEHLNVRYLSPVFTREQRSEKKIKVSLTSNISLPHTSRRKVKRCRGKR